jgi:hypothetical protein
MRVKEKTSQSLKRDNWSLPDCHERVRSRSLLFSAMKNGPLIFSALFLFFAESNAERVDRIDFYDASDNYIMFISYEYDAGGTNIAQSTFTSDSTFIKRTVVQNGTGEKKEKAVSFNFNEDTSFVTQYSYKSDFTEMTVKDQFGIDQLGGTVSYKQSGDNGFDFYQGSTLFNKLSYDKDNYGRTKINVLDATGELQYYAILLTSGPIATNLKALTNTLPAMMAKGNNVYELNFTMQKPGAARLELISLSGRHVATLFDRKYDAGAAKETVRLSGDMSHVANGIYLMSLSMNGKRLIKEKILIQHSRGGL